MSPAPPRSHVRGAERATSDSSLLISTSTSTTSQSLSTTQTQKSLITTPPILELEQKDSPYVVITVTNGAGIHITTVLLGDSYPTTFSKTAIGGGSGSSHPGISTGSIVGIAVGLSLGFLAFFAVMYIYFLRFRQARRLRRKRRRRKSNGGGSKRGKIPAAPPGGGGGGPGPPPPPPPAPPAG
ncbi:uncharacterized protein PAC_06808 [Phialocephala subalpina]|uniref:Uncharacterized protein n=1 Tax=Phialocephala subalpina TaxID=576137 RepID=A0A1L7WVX8_9HELO|nr:uncharacterized protein PAC_06808 [Phialocephala subalpina]